MPGPQRISTRRRLSVALLSASFLLAACGGGGSGSDSDVSAPSSSAPTSGSSIPPPPALGGAATAPVQATSGPGGSDYQYASATSALSGVGATSYWLTLPDGAGKAKLPVVVLVHGYGSLDESPYQAWADHLARHGAIVIYPMYQLSAATSLDDYTPNAIQGIRDALAKVAAAGGVVADTTRMIVIGHSIGGGIAANIVATAGSAGLPIPRALMAVNPAKQGNGEPLVMPIADLAQIPNGTLLLSIFSDADQRITDEVAKQIFYGANNVPVADKDYIVVNSDSHGLQALVADHFAALASRPTILALYPPDALDFYGYWKLADALMAASFTGAYRDVALGHGSAAQTFMGYWGDAQPVHTLTVTDAP